MVLTNTTVIYYNPLKFLLQYNNYLKSSYSRTAIDNNETLDFLR